MVSLPYPLDATVSHWPTGRVIFVLERRWFRWRLVPKIEMKRIIMRRDALNDDPPREVTEFYLRAVTAIDLQSGAFLFEPAPEKGVHCNG